MFYKTKQSLDQLVQNGSTPGISYQIKTNYLEENNIMGLNPFFQKQKSYQEQQKTFMISLL